MSLLAICSIAFVAVFVLLAFLAAVMQLITAAFPLEDAPTDPAVVAAISGAVVTLYPGAEVTKLEETK